MADDHAWITPALIAVVVPVAMAAFVRAADRPARVSGEVKWVEYGVAMKAFSIAAGLIPVGLIVAMFLQSAFSKDPVIATLLFTGLSVPLLLESFLVKISFDENAIYTRSAWRRSRVIPWSEVGAPIRSDLLQWWVLPTKKQGSIRLHDFISGKGEFFAMALNKRLESQKDLSPETPP
ncbi:hypothetical protein [Haloferula sp. BvORR071]|uniref:hypothetical protein n=1 Tax=Haloferula sp. BvORR071 TaxID=1396141 RepID=UPI000555B39C|nr:hypothetical protein [Haloferula sp. BvORR071]